MEEEVKKEKRFVMFNPYGKFEMDENFMEHTKYSGSSQPSRYSSFKEESRMRSVSQAS